MNTSARSADTSLRSYSRFPRRRWRSAQRNCAPKSAGARAKSNARSAPAGACSSKAAAFTPPTIGVINTRKQLRKKLLLPPRPRLLPAVTPSPRRASPKPLSLRPEDLTPYGRPPSVPNHSHLFFLSRPCAVRLRRCCAGGLCAVLQGCFPETGLAQGLPSNVASASSQSGQFIVQAKPHRPPAAGSSLAASPGLFRLKPGLVTVSCERIKQSLSRELGVTSSWQGRIFLALRPVRAAGQGITVTSEKFRDGWQYRVDLPDAVERTRYVRAVVQVLFKETGQSPSRLPPGGGAALAHRRALAATARFKRSRDLLQSRRATQ